MNFLKARSYISVWVEKVYIEHNVSFRAKILVAISLFVVAFFKIFKLQMIWQMLSNSSFLRVPTITQNVKERYKNVSSRFWLNAGLRRFIFDLDV